MLFLRRGARPQRRVGGEPRGIGRIEFEFELDLFCLARRVTSHDASHCSDATACPDGLSLRVTDATHAATEAISYCHNQGRSGDGFLRACERAGEARAGLHRHDLLRQRQGRSRPCGTPRHARFLLSANAASGRSATISRWPRKTSPVSPSMESQSPSAMRVAPILARRAAASTSNPAQLTTQGFPNCRAISEACAVRPPLAVSAPDAAAKPATSAVSISGLTENHRLARGRNSSPRWPYRRRRGPQRHHRRRQSRETEAWRSRQIA